MSGNGNGDSPQTPRSMAPTDEPTDLREFIATIAVRLKEETAQHERQLVRQDATDSKVDALIRDVRDIGKRLAPLDGVPATLRDIRDDIRANTKSIEALTAKLGHAEATGQQAAAKADAARASQADLAAQLEEHEGRFDDADRTDQRLAKLAISEAERLAREDGERKRDEAEARRKRESDARQLRMLKTKATLKVVVAIGLAITALVGTYAKGRLDAPAPPHAQEHAP